MSWPKRRRTAPPRSTHLEPTIPDSQQPTPLAQDSSLQTGDLEGVGRAARDSNPNRQVRSLVLCVDLVGSGRIWSAHVDCLVGQTDPDGSRRIVWMIKRRRSLRRCPDHRTHRWSGHQPLRLVTPGGPPRELPRSRSAFNGPILSALVLLAGVAGHSAPSAAGPSNRGRRAKCRPDLPGRRAVASPTAWMLHAWLHDLGRSGEAAFKFAWVLGEVAGDITE
jgi:hypothetical protein